MRLSQDAQSQAAPHASFYFCRQDRAISASSSTPQGLLGNLNPVLSPLHRVRALPAHYPQQDGILRKQQNQRDCSCGPWVDREPNHHHCNTSRIFCPHRNVTCIPLSTTCYRARADTGKQVWQWRRAKTKKKKKILKKGNLACSFRKLSLQMTPVMFLFVFQRSHVW